MADGSGSDGEPVTCGTFSIQLADEAPDAIYEAFLDLDLNDCTTAAAVAILRFLKRACDNQVRVPRNHDQAVDRLRGLQVEENAIVPGRGIDVDDDDRDDQIGAPGPAVIPPVPAANPPGPLAAPGAVPPAVYNANPNADWPGLGALGQRLAGGAFGQQQAGPAAPAAPAVALGQVTPARAGTKLLAAVLVGGDRCAPSVINQVESFYRGSFQAFVGGVDWKGTRNGREAETIAFAVDLLSLEAGADFISRSDTVEVLLRRLLALCEADARGDWTYAQELELVPRGRLIIPEGVRRSARKAAEFHGKDKKKKGAPKDKKGKGKAKAVISSSSDSDSE